MCGFSSTLFDHVFINVIFYFHFVCVLSVFLFCNFINSRLLQSIQLPFILCLPNFSSVTCIKTNTVDADSQNKLDNRTPSMSQMTRDVLYWC